MMMILLVMTLMFDVFLIITGVCAARYLIRLSLPTLPSIPDSPPQTPRASADLPPPRPLEGDHYPLLVCRRL